MTFMHDDSCHICERGRRARRRRVIERLVPWLFIVALVLAMAVAEWAQHG